MKLNYTNQTGRPVIPSSCGGDIRRRITEYCVLASLLEQLRKETAQGTALEIAQVADSGNVLVMLADDDSDDRELFEEVVTGINAAIHVITVADGEQLMNQLNKSAEGLPTMIFLDLNMPGKGGKECLVEIKNNALLKEIPLVIYSTSAHQKDIDETYSKGANLYMPKPTNFKSLVAGLTKVFSLDLEQLKLTPPTNQFVLAVNV